MNQKDLEKYQRVIASLVEEMLKSLPPNTTVDFLNARREIVMGHLSQRVVFAGLELKPAVGVTPEDVEKVVEAAYSALIKLLEGSSNS